MYLIGNLYDVVFYILNILWSEGFNFTRRGFLKLNLLKASISGLK